MITLLPPNAVRISGEYLSISPNSNGEGTNSLDEDKERYSEILWHSANDGVLSAADLDELIARGADINQPCLNVSGNELFFIIARQ